ncbi:kynureninase-like [Dysidea avara]|uniref:kynureninase-like n=1 Tax=Dysidea avara TaxID=196820 RepID=UPI003326FFF8
MGGAATTTYKRLASLLAAKSSHDPTVEVAIMNGLTTNLHLGMYAVESQIRHHQYDPAVSLITIGPRLDEHTIRKEDVLAKISEEGHSIALVLFSGVQYITGQFFNIEAIIKAAHSKGCYVGIDLAHAIGNVELHLTDWGVDFACWCNYKYMNGGPGSIGGFYLHKKHAQDFTIPRFLGWWAHRSETRFDMTNCK